MANNSIVSALKSIFQENGITVLNDPKFCSKTLRKLYPYDRTETDLVSFAFASPSIRYIVAAKNDEQRQNAINMLFQSLCNDTGLGIDTSSRICQYFISSLMWDCVVPNPNSLNLNQTSIYSNAFNKPRVVSSSGSKKTIITSFVLGAAAIALVGGIIISHRDSSSNIDSSADSTKSPEVTTTEIIQNNEQQTTKKNIEVSESKDTSSEDVVSSIEETKPTSLSISSSAESKTAIEKIDIEQISDKITAEKETKTYEFTSSEAGTYRFELSNVPQNIWFYFKLYNSSMEQLKSGSGDNGDGITYELDANTKYYFEVEQGGNTGSYTLSIGSQKPILDITEYTSVNDSTQFTNQKNLYEFTSTEAGTYRFELSNVPQNIWFYFKLYNSSMEQLKSGSGDNGDGITYELDANTKYYFEVEQGGNVGSYTLNVGSQKPLVDISEYISVNDSTQFTNQKNLYEFTPSKSSTYRFELSNTSNNVWFYYKLYNSSMEQLQSGSGDNGDGITYDLDANTKYYFEVEQGGNYGSYTLNYGIYIEDN